MYEYQVLGSKNSEKVYGGMSFLSAWHGIKSFFMNDTKVLITNGEKVMLFDRTENDNGIEVPCEVWSD